MLGHARFRSVPLLLAALLVVSISQGADWPHWRGPNRDGTSPESSGFDAGAWKNLKPVWRVNVGRGCSAPLVVAGKVYTTGWKAGKDFVSCHDAVTGKEIWSQAYNCPQYGRKALGDQDQYAGPSSTPEFDAATRFPYTLSTDGDLNCWDTDNQGRNVWRLNLHKRYRVAQRPRVAQSGHRDYGFTTAPLVAGDQVLVEAGAAEGTVLAFDKRTGKEAWRSELKEPAGHTGGLVPMTIEKVSCVAVLTHFHLAVMRLDDGNEGKTVARYPWVTEFANSIPTPAVHGPHVLVTSAYNQMKMCKVKITLRGAEKVWESRNPSGVCSPVIHKGRVYFAWRGIRCLDFDTGKRLWAGVNTGYPGSCIVTGDDRLICWTGHGQLYLVDARDATSLAILTQKNDVLPAQAWPHVVLASGRLFCKDRDGNLVCLALRDAGPR
ncbi:MAG: hypothetical protein FJ271_24560 [Planctomycetes bacterium]|nr:hypothetical protein [Planctomycetota bacterium]